MSITTRTNPKEKPRSCFGEGFGLAHEVDHALRGERIKPFMLKRLTHQGDPLLRQVGSLLRGEPVDQTIRIGDLVSRELAFLERFVLPLPTGEELTAGYERWSAPMVLLQSTIATSRVTCSSAASCRSPTITTTRRKRPGAGGSVTSGTVVAEGQAGAADSHQGLHFPRRLRPPDGAD